MSTLQSLSQAAVVAVVVCYGAVAGRSDTKGATSSNRPAAASESPSSFFALGGVRWALVAVLWGVFLGIPLRQGRDALPVWHAESMVAAVLSFIVPLKLSQLVLLWPATTPVRQGSAAAAPPRGSWKGFLQFSGEVLYYILPMSRAKTPPPLRQWILSNATFLLVIAFKLVSAPLVERAMLQLASGNCTGNPLCYLKLLFLFGCLINSSNALAQDLPCVLVSVLTRGHWEVLPFCNCPLFSSSLSDFWGKRYNLHVHVLLKETIYVPCLAYCGFSRSAATITTFLVSGVLHAWVAHWAFGCGRLRAVAYFALHGFYIAAFEQICRQRDAQKPQRGSTLRLGTRAVVALAFFMATSPLYFGLFVEAMPQWITNNPLPFLDAVPGLRSIVQRLIPHWDRAFGALLVPPLS